MGNAEIEERIKNCKLKKKEEKEISKWSETYKKSKCTSFDSVYEEYKALYVMRYYLHLSVTDMANYIETISNRAIRDKLNKFGWGYTREESNQFGSKKRDYQAIRLINRKNKLNKLTSMKKNLDFTLRHSLNIELTMAFRTSDVIVGLNCPNQINEHHIPIYLEERGVPFYFIVRIGNGSDCSTSPYMIPILVQREEAEHCLDQVIANIIETIRGHLTQSLSRIS